MVLVASWSLVDLSGTGSRDVLLLVLRCDSTRASSSPESRCFGSWHSSSGEGARLGCWPPRATNRPGTYSASSFGILSNPS